MESSKGKVLAILKKYGIILILIFMIVIISVNNKKFLRPSNIMNVLNQSAIYGILSLGLLLVIISKGIDLSVGSVLALSGIVAASISQVNDASDKVFPGVPMVNIVITIIVALAIGALCGAVNGSLIAYTGIPAFIATLGMFTSGRGAARLFSGGKPISNLNPQVQFFGGNLFGKIPVPVLVYVIVIIATFIILKYTAFGASVYAIGGNIHAAEISGIKVKRNLTLIYTYAGLLSGISALVFLGRTGGNIQTNAGVGYELTAIAATTIGGTSHGGGIGTVWGTVVGALILGVMTNGFTMLGVSADAQEIVQGVIIVAAVIFDMRKNAKKA